MQYPTKVMIYFYLPLLYCLASVIHFYIKIYLDKVLQNLIIDNFTNDTQGYRFGPVYVKNPQAHCDRNNLDIFQRLQFNPKITV